MTKPVGDRLKLARMTLVIGAAVVTMSTPIFVGFRYAPELKAHAQAAEHLAFEVASVKLNKSEPAYSGPARGAMLQRMALQYLPGGRFSARGVPIFFLIFEAYNVFPGPSGRITLSPEFEKSMDGTVEADRYDIEAVAEKGAIPANASSEVRMQKIRLMLQSLLADRFKVRISHETKEVPVYALVVDKNGPKLQKSAMDEAQCDDKTQIGTFLRATDLTSCHAFVRGQSRGLRVGQAVDMSDFAKAIEDFTDRPVVNQTGLNGLFKIDVPDWTPPRTGPRPTGTEPTAGERALADPARPPTISDVLQDLGLRLVSTKSAVEMFVVEHFERPAQN